jgi:hypothetical protein
LGGDIELRSLPADQDRFGSLTVIDKDAHL